TISAQGQSQVFAVSTAPAVTISGLTISAGNAPLGSAIGTDGGSLTLSGDTFTGNTAGGASGSGFGTVHVAATAATALTITNSTFSGDRSGGGGNNGTGIVNADTTAGDMTVQISGSIFHGNFVGGGGGTGTGTIYLTPA